MQSLRIGDKLGSFPAKTFNALVSGETRQRNALSSIDDTRKPKQKLPVVCRLAWSGDEALEPGHVVKLGNALFDPDDAEWAPFDGLAFHCDEFAEDDPSGAPYAILMGPIDAMADDNPSIGYGYIPGACWAKVDVDDEAHTHATQPTTGTLFGSGTSGVTILWKQSGTGEKWAVVLLGGGSGGGGGCLIALLDRDVPGVHEPANLLETADIALTGDEIAAGTVVVFKEPSDTVVANLPLWDYNRVKLTLKYYETEAVSYSGTLDAGSASAITLAGDASDDDGFYDNCIVTVTSGTGSGQTGLIDTYDGGTHVGTMADNFAVALNDTSVVSIAGLHQKLATAITDVASDPPQKIVRYAHIDVWYDEESITRGSYGLADYPTYPENEAWPPDGDGTYEAEIADFFKKRYRIRVVKDESSRWIWDGRLCEELPKPALTPV